MRLTLLSGCSLPSVAPRLSRALSGGGVSFDPPFRTSTAIPAHNFPSLSLSLSLSLVLRHRIHHRFTDTEDDPYTIKKGFFFAHMGWIFYRPEYKKINLIDDSDLKADWVVGFQHKFYLPLAFLSGFILPTLFSAWFLPSVVNSDGTTSPDCASAFLYGGVLSKLAVWHTTFCINSLAHWIGEREYDPRITAAGGMLVSLVTNGEGYHNFHHAYPSDYRNGIRWYDYDPTKWFINALFFLGLASSLRISDHDEVEKVKLLALEEKLKERKRRFNWGPADESLPLVSREELVRQVKEDHLERLVIDGYVVDMSKFKGDHPGGEKILRSYYGKDATQAFHGGLNFHTSAANSMMKGLRVGKIEEMKD